MHCEPNLPSHRTANKRKINAPDNGEADGRDEMELLGERSDVEEVLIASWAKLPGKGVAKVGKGTTFIPASLIAMSLESAEGVASLTCCRGRGRVGDVGQYSNINFGGGAYWPMGA